MSARLPPKPPRRHRQDATLDLDATLDVYEEHTADLQVEALDAPHPDMMATSRMEAMSPVRREEEAPAPLADESAGVDAGTAATAPHAEYTASEDQPTAGADDAGAAAAEQPQEDVTRLRAPAPAAGTGTTPAAATVDIRQPAAEPPAPAAAETAAAGTGEPPAVEHASRTADIAPPQRATPAHEPATSSETTSNISAAADDAANLTASAPDTAQPPAMAPGNILLGRYLLEQVIGCGGTAIVFRARDLQAHNKQAPNARLAIKTPRPELGDLERATQRLQHEFEHARRLHHPNVVEVLEFRREAGQPYMVMELIEGRLLSRVLRERAVLDADFAERILRQCAAALQHAHEQQVAHGDFKPGNVFITGEDNVRIVDFGAAATPTSDASRIPAGTPTYASPEVLQGQTPQPRDDVFSFACVAYEVLAGQHPFERISSLQAREEKRVPPRAASLSKSQWLALVAALSWNPSERPSDVGVLLEQLFPTPVEPPAAIAAAAAAVEPPPPAAPVAAPQGMVPRQRSWGFLAFLACILIVTALALRHRSGSEEPTANIAPVDTTPSQPVTAPPADTLADASAATDQTALGTLEDAPFEEEIIEVEEAPVAVAPPRPRPPAPLSEISFASPRIVTTEGSLAAVFVVNRAAPLNGRVSVNWRAESGTAKAGEDFIADAGGTIVFADNQSQRAIYVPLINDDIPEDDKTFTVILEAPRGARLGEQSTAQALIRDDD